MKNSSIDFDRLSKILARLDSNHEGEVVSAARKAVMMLKASGLSFEDVFARDQKPVESVKFGSELPLTQQIQDLRERIDQFRTLTTVQEEELENLRKENVHLRNELNQHIEYVDRIDARKQKWQEKAFDAVKLARELSGRVIQLEEGLSHLNREQAEHLI